ncbi:MAG: hypothetical protein AB4290_29640 [Spirulina sp.]
MAAIDIRKRAFELLDRLPQEALTEAVDFLENLSRESQRSLSSASETDLLKIIQRQLPDRDRERLNDLREQNEWGELRDREYKELIDYEDLMEQWTVERLEALMKLAKMRQVDLATLNQELRCVTFH